MRDAALLRLSGLAAIGGGLLRAANAFTAGLLDEHTLQISYFATDVLLIFGLIGIYLNCRKSTGVAGLAGFAMAVIGLLLVRSAAVFGSYAIAAAVTLLGTIILGAAMLADRALPRAAPLLWFASLAFGIAATLAPSLAWANAAAGVAFGLGFIAAGAKLARA